MSRRCSIDGCNSWSFSEGKCRNHLRDSAGAAESLPLPSLGQAGLSLLVRSISGDELTGGSASVHSKVERPKAESPLHNDSVPVPKILVMGNLIPGQFASYVFQAPPPRARVRPRALSRRLECQLCGAFGSAVKPPANFCQECGYGKTRA